MATSNIFPANFIAFVVCYLFNTMFDSALAQSCRYDFIATPGVALEDFVFDTTYARSPKRCALDCLSRPQCKSFNYQDFTELCQLNSASIMCAPDHVVFNGTMRHFSPPTASCWKENCGMDIRQTSPSKPELNSVDQGQATSTKKESPATSTKKKFPPLNRAHKTVGNRHGHGNTHFIILKPISKVVVELEGGDFPNEGRIEFQYQNKWGVICDDAWDMKDADVVCRQLGFENGAVSLEGNYSKDSKGRSKASILMTDLECTGDEAVIDDCKYSLDKLGKCEHSGNAGVVCMPNKPNAIVFES